MYTYTNISCQQLKHKQYNVYEWQLLIQFTNVTMNTDDRFV